jgi:probable F420-dependent oxidoreductase
MRVGLHALGIGSGADPGVIKAVATAADGAGFSTLWSGEHIVMIDRPDSPYPYSPDGRIAIPSDADWLDPLATLAFMAAVTSRIRLATGILLLAEHNPILTAKQAATLDVLSNGRFALGVGIGWSSEEFAAIGVPFTERVARTNEYVEVMRTLWRQGDASFDGTFTRFHSVRCYPKPVKDGRIPVILGGNSDHALERVAAYGDGWYGFNLSMDEVTERIDYLAARCWEAGRDPSSVHVAVSIRDGTDVRALVELGVDELVVVEAPPADSEAAGGWVASMARDWGVVSAQAVRPT